MLVSGQDIAYWDGGGSPFSPPASYFTTALGLQFNGEGNLDDLVGVPGTPFAGLLVALNTPDSAPSSTSVTSNPLSAELPNPTASPITPPSTVPRLPRKHLPHLP